MPLKVVMVGAGFVAPYHAAGWRTCDDVRLAGAVVPNPAAWPERLDELGVPGYSTLQEALDTVAPDVVDICSPAATHEAYAHECIAAGRPFMCQKPLATTFEAAAGIVNAASEAGVRGMVHENFRFRSWFRTLKRVLDEDAVGTPFYARSAQRMAGTVTTADHPGTPWSLARQPFFRNASRLLLIESVIHQVDVARYLFGEPRRIFARTRRVSPMVRGEDSVLATLCFDTLDAVIERSYASKGYPPPRAGEGESLVVEGDLGSAFVQTDGTVRVVRDSPGGREETLPACDRKEAYAASYAACIRHFVDALREDRPFETALEDNLETLRAVFAAYASASSGEAIDLATFPPDFQQDSSTDP